MVEVSPIYTWYSRLKHSRVQPLYINHRNVFQKQSGTGSQLLQVPDSTC